MLQKLGLVLFFLTCFLAGFSQQSWWIFFHDKGPESAFLQKNPSLFLSQPSIQRRLKQGIHLTETDLPVSLTYLNQVKSAGLSVVMSSRWLNAVVVSSQPTEFQLSKISSISKIAPCKRYIHYKNPEIPKINITAKTQSEVSDNQLNMIGLLTYHSQGNTGDGIKIAVFDDGFLNVNTNIAFQEVRQENRFVITRDFVEGDSIVTDVGTHGATILALLAGTLDNEFTGSAPKATYFLARTELQGSEKHAEEYNWLAAAEWADSAGVDIISSSLGYNTFDVGEGDYSNFDLNGNTAIITKAADKAASVGILVVNSAGNEGLSSWKKITVPCDGDSVLCVGAVDTNETHWYASSVGPTADGRIKPNVMAQGSGTITVFPNGNTGTSSGTSVATPLVAGLAACLWQANPSATNIQLLEAIQKSADRHTNPDTIYGNGIPNAIKADSILKKIISHRLSFSQDKKTSISCYPNPATKEIVIQLEQFDNKAKVPAFLLSSIGEILWRGELNTKSTNKINIEGISQGLYWLSIAAENGSSIVIPLYKTTE